MTLTFPNAPYFRPSRDVVFGADAVRLSPRSSSRFAVFDPLFAGLPNVGHRSLLDKQEYWRQVCDAAHRSLYHEGLFWTLLGNRRTTAAQRRVLDAAEAKGWLVSYGCTKTRATRYWVAPTFRALLLAVPIPNRACRKLVELRGPKIKGTKKRELIPVDRDHPVVMETYAKLREINALNRQHKFTADDFAAGQWTGNVKHYTSDLVAKFSGSFDLHGRLYTHGPRGYQRMQSIERGRSYIDDARTTEIDFRSMGPNIARNLCGAACLENCYLFLGDSDESCIVAKQVLSTMIGARSWKSAIHGFRKAKNYNRPNATNAERHAALDLDAAWRKIGSPDPEQLFATAEAYYRTIADYFYNGRILEIMRIDSAIALDILHGLAVQGIPAAGVHDSFLVQEHHRDALLNLMRSVYEQHLGFEPRVKECF